MKIKLELSKDMIGASYRILEKLYDAHFSGTPQEKSIKNMGLKLAEKFGTMKQKSRNLEYFNSNKRKTVNLEYHLAWALHELLINLFSLAGDAYEKHQVQLVINQINQHL